MVSEEQPYTKGRRGCFIKVCKQYRVTPFCGVGFAVHRTPILHHLHQGEDLGVSESLSPCFLRGFNSHDESIVRTVECGEW